MSVVVHTVTGEDGARLKALPDDQLVGIISAARRIEARATWRPPCSGRWTPRMSAP